MMMMMEETCMHLPPLLTHLTAFLLEVKDAKRSTSAASLPLAAGHVIHCFASGTIVRLPLPAGKADSSSFDTRKTFFLNGVPLLFQEHAESWPCLFPKSAFCGDCGWVVSPDASSMSWSRSSLCLAANFWKRSPPALLLRGNLPTEEARMLI